MDGATPSVDLMRTLRTVHLQLEIVNAGVIVAATALHHQNVDRDEDVARVLEHCVGSRLWEQIGQLAELMSMLQPMTDEAPVSGSGASDGYPPRRGGIREPVRHLDAYSLSRARVCLVATGSAADEHPPPPIIATRRRLKNRPTAPAPAAHNSLADMARDIAACRCGQIAPGDRALAAGSASPHPPCSDIPVQSDG